MFRWPAFEMDCFSARTRLISAMSSLHLLPSCFRNPVLCVVAGSRFIKLKRKLLNQGIVAPTAWPIEQPSFTLLLRGLSVTLGACAASFS